MAKFKFTVSTGYVGSERSEIIEIPDEELQEVTGESCEDYIDRIFEIWMGEQIYTGIEELD